MDSRQHFSLWYFVAVMSFMLALQSVLFSQHVETLAYSDFQSLLHAGKVKEVLIADDRLSGKEIDQEVHKLLAAAEERVRETLAGKRPELEALGRALLQNEVIDREGLAAVIEAARQSRMTAEAGEPSVIPERTIEKTKPTSEGDQRAAAA